MTIFLIIKKTYDYSTKIRFNNNNIRYKKRMFGGYVIKFNINNILIRFDISINLSNWSLKMCGIKYIKWPYKWFTAEQRNKYKFRPYDKYINDSFIVQIECKFNKLPLYNFYV